MQYKDISQSFMTWNFFKFPTGVPSYPRTSFIISAELSNKSNNSHQSPQGSGGLFKQLPELRFSILLLCH